MMWRKSLVHSSGNIKDVYVIRTGALRTWKTSTGFSGSGSADSFRLGTGDGILKALFFPRAFALVLFIANTEGVCDLDLDRVMGPLGGSSFPFFLGECE